MSGTDRLMALLPCPFCGDNHATTTYTRDGRLVVCTSCGAKSGNYYHGPKELPSADERAVAAWNRRASQATPAPCQACNGSGDASEKGRIEVCCPCKGTGKAPAPSDGLREAVSDDALMIFIQKRLANELRVAGWHDAAEYLIDDYMGQQIIRAMTDCRNAYAASPAQEGGK